MGLWWWRQSFVERERQETRGWTAVGGGADPPVRLLALSGAPGLRTVPRGTSRRHFPTRGIVRVAVRGARSRPREEHGVSIWRTPHGCFSQKRRRLALCQRKCTPVGSSEPWPCRHADEQRGPTSSGDPPAQHCRRFGDSNLGHPRPLGIPRQQAMGAPFFKKPRAVGVSPRWATSQTPPVMSMRGRTMGTGPLKSPLRRVCTFPFLGLRHHTLPCTVLHDRPTRTDTRANKSASLPPTGTCPRSTMRS